MRIGNVDLVTLKNDFGTPLYIYDKGLLKKNMISYKENFTSKQFKTEVIYASKAFNAKKMLQLVNENGLGVDVVSLGEMYTAIKVGFDPSKIYFHGNNKSVQELEYALENHIGTIVVDNKMELEALEEICVRENKICKILIRLNVGVEAHTHKFIVTGHVDSKFGVSYASLDYAAMMSIIASSKNIVFEGFHSHIGSQIFDLEAFEKAMEKLIIIAKDFDHPLTLDIGGGFGVHYTNEDKPIPFDIVAKTLIEYAESLLKKNKVTISKLCIEPGRSIVAEAGSTLYTIGYTKKTPNKQYYFIDGGMTDNIRPALYQAKYDCDVVGKEKEIKNQIVTIAGKCCESGDLIIENYPLQKAVKGDLLITYTTGAYGYAMSSNYNKALTPAVVFVEDGKTELVCHRQTLDELIEREE